MKTDQKIETDDEAWSRFERAVDAAIKSGPKHRLGKDVKDQPNEHENASRNLAEKS